MPTALTGNSSTDPTSSPTATGPADGDGATSASVNGPFQALLNGIAWLRAQAALWTGGTFTGAVNVPTPTASAHPTTKNYVDTKVFARSNLPAVGAQLSNSSGTFHTTASGPTDVPNLSVTFTTTGRPVVLVVQPDGIGQGAFDNASTTLFVYLLRDGVAINVWQVSSSEPGALSALDISPSAASHTYKVQIAQVGTGPNIGAISLRLGAYEL